MRPADWLRLARPRQWTKNLLLFAALLFSGHFRAWSDWTHAALGFAAFVLLSASVYALNDLKDADADRRHPLKKHRPVAAGRVSPAVAGALSALWAAAGLTLAVGLGWHFLWLALAYLLLSTAYTLWTKHQVILDVLSLAAGFVLRAAAGGLAIDVPVSEWLLMCTTLGALFLALGKRRAELAALRGNAKSGRRSLEHYSLPLLDQMIAVVAAATLVAYSLYTFFSKSAERGPWMMLTIPYALYGMFRYLYLIHQKGLGAAPEQVLLSDRGLQWTVALYVATSAAILAYARP